MDKVLKDDIEWLCGRFTPDARLAGKTLLITGGTGLLGQALIHCLLAWNQRQGMGMRMLALVRSEAKARQLFGVVDELCFVEGDMADLEGLRGRSFDFVIHLAAPTTSGYFCSNPVETIRTIVGGTDSLLALAAEQKVEGFVYLSSMEAYGLVTHDDHALGESKLGYIDLRSARSSYSEGKRMAENLCYAYFSEYGLPVTMVRLCQTFGPGVPENDRRVTTQFARNIVAGTDLVLKSPGETCSDHCYTLDAVTAILTILARGRGGETYNVATPDTYCSIREMAEYMVARFGKGSKVVIDVDPDAPYPPASKLRLDISKLRELGWQPLFEPFVMYDHLIKSLR